MKAWSSRTWIAGLTLAAALLAAAVLMVLSTPPRPLISVPPASSSVSVVHPTPNVLLAVRGLSRLESVSYHMERVIDLTEKQSQLFGLVQGEDAILLVAVADVTAGVDLGKLEPNSVQTDFTARKARVVLPAAEIFSVALDNERTYVHTRRTGLLARRKDDLETRARREAEHVLLEAARESGILSRAEQSAQRVVEGLLRSLGFHQIEVVLAPR